MIVADAFEGLAAIHEARMVHRVLTPERIWLGRGMRVAFSDFYIARIERDVTVHPWADDEPSAGYRAPECTASLALGVPASDVFALGLCLAQWWAGDLDMSAGAARGWLPTRGAVGQALADALADNARERPTASALTERLRQPNPIPGGPVRPDDVFDEGGRVDDRYVIRRQLGAGGLATSWLAYDEGRRTDVVLKQLHTEDLARAARAEFDAARSINDPGCARVWDIEPRDPPRYLVHEYIDGEALRDRVRHDPLRVAAAKTVAKGVLTTLEALHNQNVTHGDLSLGNIVVDVEWKPTLIDFGLLTRIGDMPQGGTQASVAPEIFLVRAASPQSDLYGFACSLLQAMLGRLPYRGPGTGADRDSRPLPLTDAEREQWGPDGVAVLDVLLTGIAEDPQARPASAAAFAERIRTAAAPIPPPGGSRLNNVNVDLIRRLYRGSRAGNAGNRGLDDEFAFETYVPTQLDTDLLPAVLDGTLDVVLLTGNPGDGKTSFLVQLRQQLLSEGGAVTSDDEAGWRITYSERSYAAVYDASESHGHQSSDDLVRAALQSGPIPHTALLAVNDGRMLQFFTDYSHEFPAIDREVRNLRDGKPPVDPRIAVVDLKRRALTYPSGDGLALAMADRLTDPARWSECTDCLSREVCPILTNVTYLRAQARPGVGDSS